MVFFIPGVYRQWYEWKERCRELLRMRATCQNMSHWVKDSELQSTTGELFATMAAGEWMRYIAYVIGKVEDSIHIEWLQTRNEHHMGLWEWEATQHHDNNVWHTYDGYYGMPTDQDEDSLASMLLDRCDKEETSTGVVEGENEEQEEQPEEKEQTEEANTTKSPWPPLLRPRIQAQQEREPAEALKKNLAARELDIMLKMAEERWSHDEENELNPGPAPPSDEERYMKQLEDEEMEHQRHFHGSQVGDSLPPDTDDGAMFYELMADYPSNWPGGSP
jgi:hypothetical protein